MSEKRKRKGHHSQEDEDDGVEEEELEDEAFEDEEEEEEEEEEEDEDDEEDEEDTRRRKKSRTATDARYFIEEEAEVADEDEEEELEEAEPGLTAADMLAADEEAVVDYESQRKMHRRTLFENLRDEEINEEMLNERYGRLYSEADEVEIAAYEDRSEIKQQSLLPSVRDPKLWMIKCRPGHERELILSLMQKFVDLESEPDRRLLIQSAIAPDHLHGTIYVEAEKEAHVRAAINGLHNLISWKVKLVPINEMTDVLKVPPKEYQLQKGSWVRVKRGVYAGDIAQVVEADEARGRVTVKLIPRLDLAHLKGGADDDTKPKRQRPPQKFFNPEEIRNLGLGHMLETRRDPTSAERFTFFENMRFKDGYLYKPMNMKSLIVTGVVPSIDELQKFQNRAADKLDDDDEDLDMLARARPQRKITYCKGDVIKVIEGDLKNLMGTVESCDDTTVTIMPRHPDLHDLLQIPINQVQKHFKVGDHVKAVSGRFEGEAGLVLRVEDSVAVVLSDQTSKEIKVLVHDLQECTEASSGQLSLGQYELHDLVNIDAHTVGMIIKVERDSFKVLDNLGAVRTIRLQEMGPKRNTKSIQGFDAHSNPISQGDVVQILDGKYKHKQATIKHLFRSFAFLHCRDVMENSGMIVERTMNLSALGGKNKGGLIGVPQSPGRLLQGSGGSAFAVPQGRAIREGGGGGFGRGRGRGARDPLINQTVRVKTGPWKGYVGIVKDATETTARLELLAGCKIITIEKSKIDPIAPDGSSRPTSRPREPTPDQAPTTPHYGARTPAYDVTRTPMRDELLATPLHPGLATPSRDAWDPTMTPRHTPAWEADRYDGSTPGEYGSTPTPSGPYYQYDRRTPTYTPATPGGYVESPAYPHAEPSPSPSPSPYAPFPQTPLPHTPHTPSAAAPATPGTFATPMEEETRAPSSWLEKDIEVRVVKGDMFDRRGYIREVRDTMCRVFFPDKSETSEFSSESLEPVVPQKKDKVKILRRDFKGQTGVLVGIDAKDGIVRMDSNFDIKIFQLSDLAKFVQQQQQQQQQ